VGIIISALFCPQGFGKIQVRYNWAFAGCWWLMPIILTTWENEIRIVVQVQPRQKLPETPFEPIGRFGGMCLSSQTVREVETGKIIIPGQPGQKSFEIPSQWKKVKHGSKCLSSH
jgi:hypothetical protein